MMMMMMMINNNIFCNKKCRIVVIRIVKMIIKMKFKCSNNTYAIYDDYKK